jgi:putative transcriptional regulator
MGEAAEKILKNIRATRAAIRERGIEAVRVHVPAPVDVRKLRHRLGMSQSTFAARFGVELRTLQNWEQGQRSPEGPARVLLQVIDRDPEAVLRALGAEGALASGEALASGAWSNTQNSVLDWQPKSVPDRRPFRDKHGI